MDRKTGKKPIQAAGSKNDDESVPKPWSWITLGRGPTLTVTVVCAEAKDEIAKASRHEATALIEKRRLKRG